MRFASDSLGNGFFKTSVNILNNIESNVGLTFKILQNRNNSVLEFYLPLSGNIKLQIYNMKGRLISTLVDSYKQAGKHTVNWDSKRFGAGVYIMRFSVPGFEVEKKVTVVR